MSAGSGDFHGPHKSPPRCTLSFAQRWLEDCKAHGYPMWNTREHSHLVGKRLFSHSVDLWGLKKNKNLITGTLSRTNICGSKSCDTGLLLTMWAALTETVIILMQNIFLHDYFPACGDRAATHTTHTLPSNHSYFPQQVSIENIIRHIKIWLLFSSCSQE